MTEYRCTGKSIQELSRWYNMAVDDLASANQKIILPKQFADKHFKLNETYPVNKPIDISTGKNLDLIVMSLSPLKYDPENKVYVARLEYNKKTDLLKLSIRKDFPNKRSEDKLDAVQSQDIVNYYYSLFVVG